MEVATFDPELTNSRCVPASISPRRLLSRSGRRCHAHYQQLPQEPLSLFVIKLDGSSFDSNFEDSGVAELKEAVKDVFHQSPIDEIISWSHVWGHFCLCYKGQKMLDYKAYIRLFGIKDGDQIFFVRHASIKYDGPGKRGLGLRRKMIRDTPAYEQLVRFVMNDNGT